MRSPRRLSGTASLSVAAQKWPWWVVTQFSLSSLDVAVSVSLLF